MLSCHQNSAALTENKASRHTVMAHCCWYNHKVSLLSPNHRQSNKFYTLKKHFCKYIKSEY